MISFEHLLEPEPSRPIPLDVKDGWARWAMHSCEERGGHWWQMEIELGSVSITCTPIAQLTVTSSTRISWRSCTCHRHR